MYNAMIHLHPWHNFIVNRSRKLVPIREKFRMIKRYDTGGGKQCPKRLKRRQKCKILKTYSTIINILIEYNSNLFKWKLPNIFHLFRQFTNLQRGLWPWGMGRMVRMLSILWARWRSGDYLVLLYHYDTNKNNYG